MHGDLFRLTDPALLDTFIAHVRTGHTGFAREAATPAQPWPSLLETLLDRSDGTLRMLLPLLNHEDPVIRLGAALPFRTIDHNLFEHNLRQLADREDRIGELARQSLEDDAYCRQHGYPELRDRVHWQSRRPPPPPLGLAEIKDRLKLALPRNCAARLTRLMRSAIGLWPQSTSPDMAPGASRLGGLPDVPAKWSWPRTGASPMLFLAQIDCHVAHALAAGQTLPETGSLVFFGEPNAVRACEFDAGDIAVFHFETDGPLLPSARPPELAEILPSCAIKLHPLIDLPDPYSEVAQRALVDSDTTFAYAACLEDIRYNGIRRDMRFYCGLSKLLGWPRLRQQYDLTDFANLGVADDRQLLLQLDEYSNGRDFQGLDPGGSLYFSIRHADLEGRRYERCEFQFQFA